METDPSTASDATEFDISVLHVRRLALTNDLMLAAEAVATQYQLCDRTLPLTPALSKALDALCQTLGEVRDIDRLLQFAHTNKANNANS